MDSIHVAYLAICCFPHNKRITVNMAPADLPKESERFDLPISVGILAAAGLIDTARLATREMAGELSLRTGNSTGRVNAKRHPTMASAL